MAKAKNLEGLAAPTEKEKLESVYAPVGINISSNSVDEIAFGIMAEILLVKNKGSLKHRREK